MGATSLFLSMRLKKYCDGLYACALKAKIETFKYGFDFWMLCMSVKLDAEPSNALVALS